MVVPVGGVFEVRYVDVGAGAKMATGEAQINRRGWLPGETRRIRVVTRPTAK